MSLLRRSTLRRRRRRLCESHPCTDLPSTYTACTYRTSVAMPGEPDGSWQRAKIPAPALCGHAYRLQGPPICRTIQVLVILGARRLALWIETRPRLSASQQPARLR